MDDSAYLKVNMLGGFSVSYGDAGKTLTDKDTRSRKVLMMLEYLITFREREIPQHELIDMLWPDEESDDPANALKTLLYRVRSAISEVGFVDGKDLILSRTGSYGWNNAYPIWIDAEEFDRLSRIDSALPPDELLNNLLQAIALYKGDFLPKTSMEPWVVPISTYYHSQYLKAVHYAVEKLNEQARFEDIIAICQDAIAVDPYDEPLHLATIRALIDTGMQQKALQHYNYVTDLFMKGFGINPSPELVALYKEIIKTTKTMETNLHVIREELREHEHSSTAFYCEYEIFKDIYRLEARAAVRTGQVVHIVLVTVMDGRGKKLSQKQLNLSMDRLQEVIAGSLRIGDTFTRYSVSQYLCMLPTASLENCDLVMQRISRNFKKKYAHMDILLQYSALPIEPCE